VEQDIGIIIPTKNRLEWCKLRTKFHSHSGFQGKILFIDSSDTNPTLVFSEFLSRNNFDNVQLVHLPNSGVHQAIEFGLQYIQPNCKYVAVSGDDDFHLPSGLRAAGQFLDSNMDYFSVAGPAITLCIEASGDKFNRKTVSKYWDEFSLLHDFEPNRFREIVQNYHNLEFSLKRTNGYLEIMKELNRAFQDHSFDSSRALEYCASIAIALEGKGGWIDNYYLIRGDHHGRPNSFPELNDLNKNSQFFPMRNAKLLSLINSRYVILLKSYSTSEIHDLLEWAPKVGLEYESRSILTKKISSLFSKIRAHLSSFKLKFLYRRFLAWIK
jgi:glycosyltransferase domain-containing protein